MPVFDWVLLTALAVSLLIGAWRGLVYEVLMLTVWVAAFVAAQWWAADVAKLLPIATASESVRYAVGFAIAFIAAAFAGGFLAWLARKLVTAVGLRPVDRVLGAAFGAVRGVVLLLVMAVVMQLTPLKDSDWWRESQGAQVLIVVLRGLKPVLPADIGQYLPEKI